MLTTVHMTFKECLYKDIKKESQQQLVFNCDGTCNFARKISKKHKEAFSIQAQYTQNSRQRSGQSAQRPQLFSLSQSVVLNANKFCLLIFPQQQCTSNGFLQAFNHAIAQRLTKYVKNTLMSGFQLMRISEYDYELYPYGKNCIVH